MKVLVIGGAGYIGSHVTRALMDRGHTVTVFDNLSSGRRENLFDDAYFIKGDIMDVVALSDTMSRGFDAMVHLAAFKAAGESMTYPEKYSVNNISGTINILNCASATGLRAMVFSSSAAVYGDPQYLPLDENHPLNPENYYGFTKVEMERILGWYDRLNGIRCAALRYFNAAGYDAAGRVRGLEKNPANLLPIIMETAKGTREQVEIFGDDWDTPDGTCIRDYIHVSDLADAHVLAMEHLLKTETSFTVNLGSENGISVKSMIETAREVTGRPIPSAIAPRRPGDPARVIASSARAHELLGWKAKCSDVKTLIESTWRVYNG
ncbi:MAG: UDP-glucose 4-epimerase GalE [Chitinispirillia bacterium]|nr:UDP-glucose 4-epimerase GalE [Chitinispirillia bacterium]MCL2242320.1 UDP-glucose 4-epimerase GalE [Chitinispirillia bacterium]